MASVIEQVGVNGTVRRTADKAATAACAALKLNVKEKATKNEKTGETLVLVYGDHLETFSSVMAAQGFIRKNLPDVPDSAFWEDADCKETESLDVTVAKDGTVSLTTSH
jgi:hypothetical protein